MLFPIMNIEIPTDNWALKSFKEYKEESTDRAMSFVADILHKPTGFVVTVGNTGRNDYHDYGVVSVTRKKAVPAEMARAIMDEFDQTCRDSRPAMARLHHLIMGDSVDSDLYDDEDTGIDFLRDGFAELFITEYESQKSYSRKKGTIVRIVDISGNPLLRHYKTATPDELKGRVVGQYWDKVSKNWVDLAA